MVARQAYSAESLARSTTTSTAYQTKTSLTFTPDANRSYAVFGSAIVDMGGANQPGLVEMNVGGQRALLECRPIDNSELVMFSGLFGYFQNASPTSQTIQLNFKSGDGTSVVGIRDARLVALRLETVDPYAHTGFVSSALGATWVSGTSLVFTPPSLGDYLIIAGGTTETSNAPGYARVRLNIDGASFHSDVDSLIQTDSGFDQPFIIMAKVTLGSTSHTINTQVYNSDPTTPFGITTTYSYVFAIRLDNFTAQNVWTNPGDSNTTNTTPQDLLSQTMNLIPGKRYLILESVALKASNTGQYVQASINDFNDGADLNVGIKRKPLASPAASAWSFLFNARIHTPSVANDGGLNVPFRIRWWSSNAASTATARAPAIAVLMLDDGQAVYGNTGSIPSAGSLGSGGTVSNVNGVSGNVSIPSAESFSPGTLLYPQTITGGIPAQAAAEPSFGGEVAITVVGGSPITSEQTFGSAGSLTIFRAITGNNSIPSAESFGGSATLNKLSVITGAVGIPSAESFGTTIAPPVIETAERRIRTLGPERRTIRLKA